MPYIEPCAKWKKIMEKKNQENKEILEKYLRIGPNKEMRERRKSGGIRPKKEKRMGTNKRS